MPIELATVKELFEKHSVHIAPDEVIKVFDKTMINQLSYLSPSAWGAVFGASDMALIIVNKSLEKKVAFNTNSDWSWIITGQGVLRAKYGTLWQQDRGSGFHSWGTDKL